ncbi:Xeroderma pigmentosum G N-region [Fragilaria crotonensis]|nr:Xeroderma pigmentosum G N-region [Fragilaria crotonensis]
MGIQGLLKGLQGYSEKSNIRRFSNQSIAIDASSWLHKSVYSISEKYVESSERSRTELDASSVRVATQYMQKRCQELFSSANIAKLYLVFDGKRCPLKAVTNDEREERRNKNLKEARHFRKQGRRDKAEEKYRMCIKIHAAFADAVADALQKIYARDNRLKCIFSPYEADAQLARLCVDKVADAIITEDSDVLVYSASCHISIPIIYKLDRQTGDCDLLSMDWLIFPTDRNRPAPSAKKSGGALDSVLQSLADRQRKRPGLGARLFVQACVLAGSDYSPSKLNGIGLVNAFKLLRDNAHRPCNDRFRYLLDGLAKKYKGSKDMQAYENLLAQSEAVFYHHPVLNDKNEMAFLTCLRSSTINADGPYDYHPLLDRFGEDLWFLGHIDECRGGIPNLPDTPISHATQFPVKEIVLKASTGMQESVEDMASKRRRVDDGAGANEALLLVQSVKNPYNKSSRKPFEDVSNKETSTNPFESFSFGQAQTKKNDGYSAYVRNRSDLRFTKRKFNENGKPVNPNYKVNTRDIVKPALFRSSSKTAGVQVTHTSCNAKANVDVPQSTDIDLLVDETFSARATEAANIAEIGAENPPFHESSGLWTEVSSNVVTSSDSEGIVTILQAKHFRNRFRILMILRDSGGVSDSFSHARRELTAKVSHVENTSSHEVYCLPECDGVQSPYFVSSSVNARRVTLETPAPSLDEFECTGTYVNLALSSVKRREKPSSPGDESVLSEVDEMVAAAIPYQSVLSRPRHSTCLDLHGDDVAIETPSNSRSFLRSGGTILASTATPFQNNFNPIQRHSSRPSSRTSKQMKIYDALVQADLASSMEKRLAKSFVQKKDSKNRITSYFGYPSVVAESMGDDGNFMGL